jgi:hypothetical protein
MKGRWKTERSSVPCARNTVSGTTCSKRAHTTAKEQHRSKRGDKGSPSNIASTSPHHRTAVAPMSSTTCPAPPGTPMSSTARHACLVGVRPDAAASVMLCCECFHDMKRTVPRRRGDAMSQRVLHWGVRSWGPRRCCKGGSAGSSRGPCIPFRRPVLAPNARCSDLEKGFARPAGEAKVRCASVGTWGAAWPAAAL